MDAELGTLLLDSLQIGVILLDHEGRITTWNAWMVRHSALKATEVVGRRVDEVFPEVLQTRLQGSIDQALHFRLSSMLAPGLSAGVLPLYHKPSDRAEDQRMQLLLYITPLRHPHSACIIQIHDMTATVRRERHLRAQSSQLIETSYRDPLTGVGNRRRFDRDLSDLFRAAQLQSTPLTLIMIDVDEFKAYNDRFGHLKGDECLVMVAQALKEGLRQEGDQLSRYGGEEFALPLQCASRESACAIAERLRARIQALELPHPSSRVAPFVTVSVGVTTALPVVDEVADVLVAHADLALYMAKDQGRNRCAYFDPESHQLAICG